MDAMKANTFFNQMISRVNFVTFPFLLLIMLSLTTSLMNSVRTANHKGPNEGCPSFLSTNANAFKMLQFGGQPVLSPSPQPACAAPAPRPTSLLCPNPAASQRQPLNTCTYSLVF